MQFMLHVPSSCFLFWKASSVANSTLGKRMKIFVLKIVNMRASSMRVADKMVNQNTLYTEKMLL